MPTLAPKRHRKYLTIFPILTSRSPKLRVCLDWSMNVALELTWLAVPRTKQRDNWSARSAITSSHSEEVGDDPICNMHLQNIENLNG